MKTRNIFTLIVLLFSVDAISQDQVYVGAAFYMQETDQVYLNVLIKDGVEFTFREIADKADSIIYQEEELTRKLIPFELASQYFDIVPKIKVFNRNGDFRSNAQFLHWEYYNGLIEGKLTAVYELESKKSIDRNEIWELYAVQSLAKQDFERQDQFVQTEATLPEVCKFLNIRTKDVMYSSQVEYIDSGSKYYFLSTGDYRNNIFVSYILIEENQKLTLLTKRESEFVFRNITATKIWQNCHPVFLIEYAKPETDWIWAGLERFTNDTYVSLDKNVLPIKENDCP